MKVYTIADFPDLDTPPPGHPPVRRRNGKAIIEKKQVWVIENGRELWAIVALLRGKIYLRPYGNLDGRPRIWGERTLRQCGKVWEDAVESYRRVKELNEANPPDPDAEISYLLEHMHHTPPSLH